VAVFDAGRIVEQGPPQQIFDAPTTERTRDFPEPPRLARRDALAAIRHDRLQAYRPLNKRVVRLFDG